MKKSHFPILMTGWVTNFPLMRFPPNKSRYLGFNGANAVSKGPEKEKVIKATYPQTLQGKIEFSGLIK
jgi:hypothetical protein